MSAGKGFGSVFSACVGAAGEACEAGEEGALQPARDASAITVTSVAAVAFFHMF